MRKNYDSLDYDERIEIRGLAIRTISDIYPHYKVASVRANDPDLNVYRQKQDNVREISVI